MNKFVIHFLIPKGMRLLSLISILAAALLPLSFAATNVSTALAAPAANQWYDGLIQYTTVTNCVSIIQGSPYLEKGMGAYVGFYADPNAGSPSPNAPYYAHVYLAGLGNPCSGGTRSYIDIGLPANTSFAINSSNKVLCYYDNALMAANQCPQVPSASNYNPGFFAFLSTDTAHGGTWAIAQGHTFEMQIPLISSTALTNSSFQAAIWAIDGESSPWLNPTEGVYVFNATPSILYPSPSTTNIATTTAHSTANLFTHGLGGTGWFDLGTSASYGYIHESIAIPAGGNSFSAYDDWGPPTLAPNTLYHWHFTFNASNGGVYVGSDQTFTTLPDGLATIGSGSAAGCTESAFISQLASAKQVEFNCGPNPVTITLTSPQNISSNLTINGGNKVTFNMGGTENYFTVQAGAHLTLNQLDISNGLSQISCGGAIHVMPGGLLNINEVRFTSNNSYDNGGAVCVDAGATAVIQSSLFSNNYASQAGAIQNNGSLTVTGSKFTSNSSGSFGGAIGNYGTATITGSTFNQNTAPINGGAIDSTGALTVNSSNFNGNSVVYRGGAIYNFLGTLNVNDSGFVGNKVNAYGGGIANDGGIATIERSLFNANTAGDTGGGVANNNNMTLENTTFAGNSAANSGGGVTNGGTTAFVNVTLSGNWAGVLNGGGSIYLGTTSGSSVSLKNTIVSGGFPNNCDKVVSSLGNNLESANTCGLAAGGDKINLNPRIDVLAYRGGPTPSMVPFPGSPAIDAANNSGCPAIDQRSAVRPVDGDTNGSAVCDIGAAEFNPGVDKIKLFIPFVRK